MDVVAEHQANLIRQERRRELGAKTKALMPRVLELEGKFYPGYGYHWSKYKTLGFLLQRLFDFDKAYGMEDDVLCEVVFEGLLEDVEAAEDYVRENHQ